MKAPQAKPKNRPESWLEAEQQFGGPRKAKAYFGREEANQGSHLLLIPPESIFLEDEFHLSSYILVAAMRCALL